MLQLSQHKKLQKLSEFGVGKVTGAGGLETGSGMILFLAKESSLLKAYLEEQSIEYVPFKQDFDGVKLNH